MSVPNGTPGAETSGLTSGDSAVTAEGTEQIQAVAEGEHVTGGPAPEGSVEPGDAQSDDSQATAESGDDSEAPAEADATAAAADQADLERYPESVRERFKTLKPAERRALYEHAETNAREQIEAANKRTAELQAAEAERQAQIQAVLDTQGEFIGTKPIKMADFGLTEENGFPPEGPTYDELVSLMGTRGGRAKLADTYGLNDVNAEWLRTNLERGRNMLGSSAKFIEDNAWNTLAVRFKAGLEAIPEIDAEALVAGATGPEDVIARFSAAKDERHGREMAALRRDFEGRIKALDVNGEAMKGRVVAAESRRLPTGGRTGSSAAGGSVVERLIAEAGGREQFAERAARGEYAGVDLTK